MSSGIPAAQQHFHTEFGIRLKAARNIRGVSIAKLATLIDVPEQEVRDYEAGTERMPYLVAMLASHELKVPINFFALKFEPRPSAEGQTGERSCAKIGMEVLTDPVLQPEVQWAMLNLASKLVELENAKNDASGGEANSVRRQSPDNEPPS